VIAAICRRFDGIPLAIELAAARAAALGIEEVAARLDDRFRLLSGGRRTALPRHMTLRATLDWSFELLPEPECVILRRLAIFAGVFSLEAASAVVASAEVTPAEVVDGLSNLVAKSLVAMEVNGPVTRYHLLDTTRAYALEKLDKAGEQEAVARVTPNITAISSSGPKPNWRRDPRPSCRSVTEAKSTICARRSTGPFRRAAICQSAWR
jgi:predicted ATPase